ncbi:MAG: DNA-directed RNA polymerase subunit alpha [Bacteroidota bacterium]
MQAIHFQIPEKITVQNIDKFNSVFTFKPLDKGYGVTIGNALRRVLLSSLEGHAITSISIPGVQHEFSTIEGVTEDVVEIVLNLKQVRLRKIVEGPTEKIRLPISQQKVLKAGDIMQVTDAFEVLNPDLVICHVDETAHFTLELSIEQGRGYVPAEENKPENPIQGLIPIDAIFSPVKNVKYHVAYTRVEQKTDYESLSLSIQTDGAMHPEEALERAADILIDHFRLLTDQQTRVPLVLEQEKQVLSTLTDPAFFKMREMLSKPLDELQLSARAYNCLRDADIKTLGDLVQLRLDDISKLRNFGEKSFKELKDLVDSQGLAFGMDISSYLPLT